MVELVTVVLLLGPPVALTLGALLFYRSRRRRGRRLRRLTSTLLNFPLSFLSSTWMTYILSSEELLGFPNPIPVTDRVPILTRLGEFGQLLQALPVLGTFFSQLSSWLPPEVQFTIILAVFIFIILLPG